MDTVDSQHPPFVSASQLASRLGRAEAPLVLDVRKEEAYDAGPRLLPGALRVAPGDLAAAAAALPRDRDIVAYCVHGHEVSQGAARFLYVPAGEVADVAVREGAIPYDVPNVRISHRGLEGELCSFDALVADCGLDDPALHDLARIVRGADTGKPKLTPQSPGLLAVSLGLSTYFPDDHAMLDAGMVVYDAFHAWLRSARAETHNALLFRKS